MLLNSLQILINIYWYIIFQNITPSIIILLFLVNLSYLLGYLEYSRGEKLHSSLYYIIQTASAISEFINSFSFKVQHRPAHHITDFIVYCQWIFEGDSHVAVLARAHTSSPSRTESGRRKTMGNGRRRTIWQEGFPRSASGVWRWSTMWQRGRGGKELGRIRGRLRSSNAAHWTHSEADLEWKYFLWRNMREFLK